MTPQYRDMARKTGHQILEMAIRAQESGQIEGFEIFRHDDDPSIIIAIVPHKSKAVN